MADGSGAQRATRVLMTARAQTQIGGLETSFARLADDLRAVGLDVTVAVFGRHVGGSATEAFLGEHFPVRAVRRHRAWWPLVRDADVVHVHASGVVGWGWRPLVLARLAGALPVITIHLPSYPQRPPRLRGRVRLAFRLGWRGALLRATRTVVAAPSTAAARTARKRYGFWRLPVTVLLNGAADRGEPPLRTTDGPLRVLFLGRLDEHKRPLAFVDGVRVSVEHGADVRARIVGTGALHDDVERQIERLGLRDRITLEGFTADPWPHLTWADVMVLPSYTEGGPVVVLEAAAAGVCVVAREGLEGLRDTLGDAAHYVERPEPLELGTALARLAADRGSAHRLGRRARERFTAELTSRKAAERIGALYARAGRDEADVRGPASYGYQSPGSA
jgi:glycosyltransferase involved in cell wall biosynthesis